VPGDENKLLNTTTDLPILKLAEALFKIF